jgi:excisionase family DNA binding protein
MERWLLRVSEAAELLSISRSQCYELVATKVLPSVRLGSAIRIPRRDLEAWIEAQTNTAGASWQGQPAVLNEEARIGHSRVPRRL